MKKRQLWTFTILGLAVSLLTGCPKKTNKVTFSITSPNFVDQIGDRRNEESYNYQALTVNPIANLRDDFLMGVDASMVLTVEENGGVYYNFQGQEQEVFQIMARQGVNAFRVRLWNNPYNVRGEGYGGGDVNVARAIDMALRAQAAGMHVIVDFHYSDFWADPDTQEVPRNWATITTINELADKVKEFTSTSLYQFKNAGVNVSAVQIGNEINNGMIFPLGQIDWNNLDASFVSIAKILKAGIEGAKVVNKNIYSIIHLANGGNKDEFDVFFSQLKKNNVNYDIIGASYYPYYHGTLEQLQVNLDNVSQKFNKPVIVAEMSYGFTSESAPYAANTYDVSFEDNGKYLTSIQGQATAIHDVIEVLANVPESQGLGIFYWEPAWLPVEGAGWATVASSRVSNVDGLATWSNQGLFSYTGKALPSLATFSKVRGEQQKVTEVATKVRTSSISVTLNIAENEVLPNTYPVETNLGAIRQMGVSWNPTDVAKLANIGQYVVQGKVIGKYDVTAEVTVIENFVRDPSYENQGVTDAVVAPWVIVSQTPAGEKVVKLDRKTDTRTGTTDLNWYHSSQDFSFTVKQDITGLSAGRYSLSVYCMAISPQEKPHQKLEIYIKYNNGVVQTYDLKDQVMGWGSKETYYVKAEISNLEISSSNVEIGITVEASAQTWGHLDDWALVKI